MTTSSAPDDNTDPSSFTQSEQRALSLLIDAHCHPTDDPTLSSSARDDVDSLARRILADNAHLGGICAMSTSTEDQALVKRLKETIEEEQQKIDPKGKQKQLDFRACFGYHPWFVHTISLSHPAPPKEEHYRSIFLEEGCSDVMKVELEDRMNQLPEPRSLQDVLEEMRSNLKRWPDALVGEVGLDRAFRLPREKDENDPPPNTNGNQQPSDGAGKNEHTLARRGKKLSHLYTPPEHQKAVLMAQIGLAIELDRSVSLHSVRAGEATVDFFKDCCRKFNGIDGRGFREINIDLHSCTLSPESLLAILPAHPNIYVSFSTAINSRQKGLELQLELIPPNRLLIESDWHGSRELSRRNLAMMKGCVPWLLRKRAGDHPSDEELDGSIKEEDLIQGAEQIASNWRRFVHDPQGSTQTEEEEEELDRWADFEEQWWKDVRRLRIGKGGGGGTNNGAIPGKGLKK